ncbi:hypothetical protein LQE92_05965 [Lacrimispora sp. NSJ-141]|uniref:SIS domain-containing protein n=1 Tax=Lientehia hominis TaxID=2897778 RepID=A0AAP2RJW8_9FIRM|nr:hypothetical protein [Lientehia hominis]MCD2492173.1 hypothetical protein [Lientehia hominis]
MGNLKEFACAIIDELTECLHGMKEEEVKRLYSDIVKAKRVFAWAPGRCQAMLRCFVTHLSQAGKTAYMVGDTITPAIGKEDLLIIASGAGHNIGVASIAERARGFGARAALLTIVPESLCRNASDYAVIVPGRTAACGGIGRSIQPGGGKYEQSLLLFLEAVVSCYRTEKEICSPVKEREILPAAVELAERIRQVEEGIKEEEADSVLQAVENTLPLNGRVFVWAPSSRPRNLLRCYLMRLMHMGIRAFVWDDTVCPEIQPGDVFILSDRDGENPLAKSTAVSAAAAGARVFLLSEKKTPEHYPECEVVYFPVPEEQKDPNMPGCLYELSMLILLDAMIAEHNENLEFMRAAAFELHANLE